MCMLYSQESGSIRSPINAEAFPPVQLLSHACRMVHTVLKAHSYIVAEETDGCTAELHVLGSASDTQKVKVSQKGPVNAVKV